MATFRGYKACACLIEWLPVYEKMLLKEKVIKKNIDIYQLIGGAAASAGTHSKGGAFDIAQTQAKAIKIARDMGAPATWHRPKNWDGRGGIAHTHGVLRGCPHNTPARYQITAVEAGYNGLGAGGRGGKDTGPRPINRRTYKQGIAWAKQQLEEDMAISDADMDKLIKKMKAELFKADVVPIEDPVGTEESRKKNPKWQVLSVLGVMLREVVSTRNKVDEVLDLVKGDAPVVPGKDPK